MTAEHAPPSQSIILFDGVCHFCNGSVNYIIDHDPRGQFVFAPLQSAIGQSLLEQYRLAGKGLDSIVLVEQGKAYTKSTAALRIGRRLHGWSAWAAWLAGLVPRLFRDGVYDLIARNRYRWFGKSDACRMPTPEIRQRFLA